MAKDQPVVAPNPLERDEHQVVDRAVGVHKVLRHSFLLVAVHDVPPVLPKPHPWFSEAAAQVLDGRHLPAPQQQVQVA